MGKAGKILLFDKILEVLRPLLDAEYETVCLWEYPEIAAMPAETAAGIRVILTLGGPVVERSLVEALPQLKLIVSAGVGYDGIDVAHARARGIAVTNAAGANAADVADHAVGLILASVCGIVPGHQLIADGQWTTKNRGPLRRSVADQRVGIVGLGMIGQAIAERLDPFGCDIAWYGPRPKADARWPRAGSLLALARDVDILIVAAPLTGTTEKLVGRELLDALGPKGLLVNISRGALVDEDALRAALRDGRLGAAALDVQVEEPCLAGVWDGTPNLLMTPHLGGHASGGLENIRQLLLANLRRFFAGEPLANIVNE